MTLRPSRSLVAVVLAASLVATACGSASSDTTVAPSTTPGSPGEPGPGAAELQIGEHGYDARVAAVVAVPSMPRGIAFVAGHVWVASARTDELVAIDPQSDEVVATIALDSLPVTLMPSESGDLWVAVLNGDATGESTEFVRIDTARMVATDRVAVPAFHAIPVVGSMAWAMGHDGKVRQFDLDAGAVVAETEVDAGTIWIGADDNAVWGVGGEGAAWRLETESLRVTDEIELGFRVPGRSRVAVGGGRFWVATRGHIVAVDAATGELVVDLDRPGLDLVNDLDVVDDTIFVSLVQRDTTSPRGEGRLIELDQAGATVREWAMGAEPSELVVHAGTVWIGDQQSSEVLRLPIG